MINWIISMFTDAMQWEHGVEFICAAFQNRVAHAMCGDTLHTSGGITIGHQKHSQKLQHNDVELLHIRNQNLRCVIVDECFMIPGDLLGTFAAQFESGARDTHLQTAARRERSRVRWLQRHAPRRCQPIATHSFYVSVVSAVFDEEA